jgi:hypothetical protein
MKKRAIARLRGPKRRSLEFCVLCALAQQSPAQVQIAENLLVNLDFTSQPIGALPYIANAGTAGGGYEAIQGGNTVPVIRTAPGGNVKSLYLDGTSFLMSVAGQTVPPAAPSRLNAPAGVVGPQPSRSVEVWAYNEAPRGLNGSGEETVLAWGKRGGGDGQNFSCLYGTHPTWSAVGQWGGPDLNWSPFPTAGTWRHLVWVHTGPGNGADVPPDTTQLYVDGEPNNSESGFLLNTHQGPILIGSQMEPDGVTPTAPLRGTMFLGKVRVHDGALTAAQVLQNYQTEKPQFPTTTPASTLASGPIHRWSFNQPAGAAPAGTTVTDSAGYRHARILGANASFTGTSVSLSGGPSATESYVDLPNRLISSRAPELGGSGEVTLEVWFTHTGPRTWARVFDFGSSNNSELFGPGGGGEGRDYLTLTAQVGDDIAANRLELRNVDPAGNGPSGNGGPAIAVTGDFGVPTSVERHLTVVWRNGVGIWVYEGTTPVTEILSAGVNLAHLNDVNNWLGRSNWTGDQNTQGEFNEFRVYDRALTAAEVARNDAVGPDAVLPPPTDFDGDGLPDWWEALYAGPGVNVAVGGQAALDPDGDTRTNLQEFQSGTHPQLADTDADGANDGVEAALGTNPLLPDSDEDGLKDGQEVAIGTDPLDVDTDGDTYSDGAEVAAGSNPLSASSIPVIFLSARYSFSETSGATVTDSISGWNGQVRGEGATWTGSAISLPGAGWGGSNGPAAYVDLPNGLASRFSRERGGRGSVTFEGWVTITPRPDGAWQRIIDFGSTYPGYALGEVFSTQRLNQNNTRGMDYLILTGARGDDVNLRRIDWTNDDPFGGTGNNYGVDFNATPGTVGAPLHFVITIDETTGKLSYYENGVAIPTPGTPLKLNQLNDVNCWLGRSNWAGDGSLAGEFDEFRVYSGAFTPNDVQKSFAKGPATLPTGTNPATDITTLKVMHPSGWPEWYLDRNPSAPAPGSDLDGDGLTALQEMGRGSDPAKLDTDGDGLFDGAETGTNLYISALATGSSPTNPDTDGDGLNDQEEIAAGANPSNPDTDNDLALDGSDPIPSSSYALERPMAHRWTFNELNGNVADGTTVIDSVGGAHAVVRGTGATANGASLLLPGGPNNGASPYVDLPNGIISSKSRLTAVAWVTIDSAANWARVWDFGNSTNGEVPPNPIGNGSSYFFLSASRGTNLNDQRLAIKTPTSGESLYDWSLTNVGLFDPGPGVEIFFAATMDSSSGTATISSFNRDGTWIQQNAALDFRLNQVEDLNNWLGRSQYAGDPNLNGAFNEFRLYNGILNRNELYSLFAGGPEGIRVTNVQRTGADLALTWTSRPGINYQVESSANLVNWNITEVGITATDFSTTKTYPITPGSRYFRVRIQAP